jgi:hypothetical protein
MRNLTLSLIAAFYTFLAAQGEKSWTDSSINMRYIAERGRRVSGARWRLCNKFHAVVYSLSCKTVQIECGGARAEQRRAGGWKLQSIGLFVSGAK